MRRVILVCGKRLSGKDWFIGQLVRLLGAVHFSPTTEFKRDVCRKYSLDYGRLQSERAYKEQHRHLLVSEFRASNERAPREYDERVVQLICAESGPRLILVDVRLRAQVEFYMRELLNRAECVLVRVRASDEVRARRGFAYTAGVDDEAAETDLDGARYDGTFENENARPAQTVVFIERLFVGYD